MKKEITLLGVLVLLLSACKNGADADKKTDTTKPTATIATTPAKPANELVVWHKVADFDKWMKAYEADDSVRTANGLHSHVVGRDLDDPSMVLVAMTMDDAAKAKALTASPQMKTTMEKAGVTGKPVMMFVDRQMMDTSSNAITTRLMIMHKVKDFDTWKKSFDADKPNRANDGVIDRALGYSVDDKNDVFLVFAVKDVKKAKEILGTKAMKDKMAAGGVIGAPIAHFYTAVKSWK